jgi:hypothetical protein
MRPAPACILVLFAASVCNAQLVIGGGPAGQIWNVNPASPASPSLLASGAAPWGMTYDPATNTLYWIATGNASYTVFKSPFGPAGLTPTVVGGGVVPGGSYLGMAFDSSTNKLYANLSAEAGQTSIYEISTFNGASTLAATLPQGRFFTGLEYDAARDRFLGVSGSPLGQGDGLFQINFRSGPPSYTQIALYPVVETQIDALAIGNDRAYLVNADGPIFVLNLVSGLYEPHLNSPLTGSGNTVAGAAYIPAPASAACLTAWFFVRRRRR